MNLPAENSGHKSSPESKQNATGNKTLYLSLVVTAILAFIFTLAEYKWRQGGKPLNRLGYGIFVSVLPAMVVFVVLKFTNFSISLRGAVLPTWVTATLIYFLLFILVFVSAFLMK